MPKKEGNPESISIELEQLRQIKWQLEQQNCMLTTATQNVSETEENKAEDSEALLLPELEENRQAQRQCEVLIRYMEGTGRTKIESTPGELNGVIRQAADYCASKDMMESVSDAWVSRNTPKKP